MHAVHPKIYIARNIKLFIVAFVDREAIKSIRRDLGLTQQAFASLIGLSFVSVNKWENGGSNPTGLSAVLLELLASAIKASGVEEVKRELRATGGVPLEVVRVLTAMERKNGRTRHQPHL